MIHIRDLFEKIHNTNSEKKKLKISKKYYKKNFVFITYNEDFRFTAKNEV